MNAVASDAGLPRARIRSAVAGVGLLVVAGVLLAAVLEDPQAPWFQPADDRVLSWVEEHRREGFITVARGFDLLGSTVVTLPVRLFAIAVLLIRRRWAQLLAFTVALVVSEACIGPLKALVDRPRPPSIVETTAASFPSGHAIAGAVTAFGLVAAFFPRGRRRLHWTAGAAAFAGSMAWSRTYLGAHWATDTIAGVCIGVGVALLAEVAVEQGRGGVGGRLNRGSGAPSTT